MSGSGALRVELCAVIIAVTENRPRVLTVDHAPSGLPALPSGPLDPIEDRTLELGLRGWVRARTGLELGYVEQLYTFGDRDRDPDADPAVRRLSVAYLALVREAADPSGKSRWRDLYGFFPWEDHRERAGVRAAAAIRRELLAWAGSARERKERLPVAYGRGKTAWDPERALERYEILWEAGRSPHHGRRMALDHRRVLATALGRLRGKIRYRPIVFELMPESFTLLQLQRAVEALAGTTLHKQNFRRLLETGRLVEGTGETFAETGGRPAELFRFRREVQTERPSAGVSYPRG